jgi:hypothetical protein
MHLRKGDRVKFLNDTGGGIITEITDSKMAMVMTADGFEMPVPVAELILVESSGSGSQQDQNSRYPGSGEEHGSGSQGSHYDEARLGNSRQENEQATDAGFPDHAYRYPGGTDSPGATGDNEGISRGIAERNLLFALVETQGPGMLDAWLINDSSFNVLYNILIKQDELYSTMKAGIIEADTKIFLNSFSRERINAFVSFRVQAIFFRKGFYNPLPPSQKEFSIDPMELFGTGFISGNDFFEEDAAIIPVMSDSREREIKKIAQQEITRIMTREKPPDKKKDKIADPSTEEVDLHIEELIDDHSGLSGREVLEIQMSRFTTALEGAIKGRTKRIVFIHGIGNGKLKFEIRRTLDKKNPRLKYQDASFLEYGYGATMVIIRK